MHATWDGYSTNILHTLTIVVSTLGWLGNTPRRRYERNDTISIAGDESNYEEQSMYNVWTLSIQK